MEPLITWTTVEFEEKDRHPDWIWTAGLVFGLAAAIAFFYNNLFFGIFLCVAGGCVILFALRKPKQLTITLTKKALSINETEIDVSQIKGFWIDESQKPDKLLLSVQGSFVPIVAILLESVTTDAVRTAFETVTKETEMHESIGVKIFERLGF